MAQEGIPQPEDAEKQACSALEGAAEPAVCRKGFKTFLLDAALLVATPAAVAAGTKMLILPILTAIDLLLPFPDR